MTEYQSFVVAPSQLPSLGDLVRHPASAISPFDNAEVSGSHGNLSLEELQELGICDSRGEVELELRRTLRVLNAPLAYVRVHMTDTRDPFDQVLYHASDGGVPVSITTSRDGLRIEDPAPTDQILMGLRRHLGETRERSFLFEAVLPKDQALVLSVLVDLLRKRILQTYVSDRELDRAPLNADQVLSAMNGLDDSPQWMSAIVRKMCGYPIELDAPSLGVILDQLMEAGHLDRSGTGYFPSEPVRRMAHRMLLLDKSLYMETGRQTPRGKIVAVGFTCLQAGVQDLLYLEQQGDYIQIEGQSSAAIIEMIRHFLHEAEALKELAEHQDDPKADVPPPDPSAKTLVADSEALGITFLIEKGSDAGQQYVSSETITIGRDTVNSLPLSDPKVSRRHARINPEGMGLWMLEDLGSANGTFLNGDRLGSPRPVQLGDRIRVGDSVLLFHSENGNP